ncbi:MAG: molecular chaperone TorD family protein [Eggerthellaceae bacterium]|nr:molecular chaperone TorD family protein [Eggerthellaceae bacterium]
MADELELTDIESEEDIDETAGLAEIAQLCKQRADTYGLLSRLYHSEVDQDLLDRMKTMRFPRTTGNDKLDEGYRLIAKYLSNTWTNSVMDLAREYVRIFIGHGNDAFAAAYPYESVYTSEKRLMMQAARDEVLAIYRSYGMDKDPSWKEAEDHIGLECEFMRVLCLRTADALRRVNTDAAWNLLDAQRNFLEDHLLSWSGMMTKDMRKFAKTDLYRGLASVTDGFFHAEKELLDEMLSDEETDGAE